MSIVALLFPVIFYGIYGALLRYVSATTILFHLLIGLFLGLYVVVMKKSQYRRVIALIHSVVIIVLFCLQIDAVFLWVYQLGGLSIALTRHDKIQPLCPLPKTRMMIMTGMPLLGMLFSNISGLSYMISGLLMGSIYG